MRREIHEGLNVVEQWNGATDFVFFARRGEMASNRREDHEISMLSLHLIQNCMVYINTLMIQKVLARPRWQQAMTPRDYREPAIGSNGHEDGGDPCGVHRRGQRPSCRDRFIGTIPDNHVFVVTLQKYAPRPAFRRKMSTTTPQLSSYDIIRA